MLGASSALRSSNAYLPYGAWSAPVDVQAARRAVIDNFGFIDTATHGSARDGCIGFGDLMSASSSGALVSLEAQLLAALALDPIAFAQLDTRDGARDGTLQYWALARGQGDGDHYLHNDIAYDLPQAFDAHYNDDFYAMLSRGQTSDGRAVSDVSDSSPAVRTALDQLDGQSDGQIDVESLKNLGALNAKILETPANDGSGRGVLEAAFNALWDDYKQRDIERDGASQEDIKRLDFLEAVSAKSMLAGGIPMHKGPDGVTEDIPADFVASQVLDADKVDAAYNQLLGDPLIQADLASKVKALTPDLTTQVLKVKSYLMSSAYSGVLRSLETQGRAAEANDIMSRDLAALRMLDEQAAQEASEALLQNMIHATVDESNFTNIPQGSAVQAIYDVFQVTGPLKGGRVGMRVTGQIATLITTMNQIKEELSAVKGGLEKFSANLANLFKMTQASGGDISDPARLMNVLDSADAAKTMTAAERTGISRFITELDRVGAWQMGAAIFGIAGGVYRLAVPGSHPWDRLYAAQEFLASASYTTGPAKAFAQFLEARAGESASKFNAAMKKPLMDLVKLSQVGPLDEAIDAAPDLARPSATSIASTLGSEAPDVASLEVPLELATKHRLAAGFVKGFAVLTEVGSGAIGVALGAKMIAEGVSSGRVGDQVVGALSLISGVSTVVGGALSVAFAAGTPFLIFGGAMAIIGLFVTMFTAKSNDERFADSLEQRWKNTGFLREGWREPTQAWWREHADTSQFEMDL